MCKKKYCYKALLLLVLTLHFFLLGCCTVLTKNAKSVATIQKKAEPAFILSSRSFHPKDKDDKENTMEAIDKLKPQRIDWVYFENDEILKIYRDKGLEYSLTLNPQTADPNEHATKRYRIEDYEGKLYVAPWMKSWKTKTANWGCVNNPGFYKTFLDRALFLAKKKPYALMVDDAVFNVRLQREKLVGCFCAYCLQKFEKLQSHKSKKHTIILKEIKNTARDYKEGFKTMNNNDLLLLRDYEEFQKMSVITFLKNWRNEVSKKYPKMIYLTNNYNGQWNEIYSVFDGGIAELNAKQVTNDTLDELYQNADNLNKSQVFSCASKDDKIQMELLKYNIINNRDSLLPWDIFISGSDERYYMNLEKLQKLINN